MARWAFKAFDLRSGNSLGDLALSSWSHTDTLNDAGEFDAVLAWRKRSLDRLAIDSTLAAKSLIVPYRNGVPLGFAGIVWRPDPPNLAGAGLLSYFDAQTLDADRTYNPIDQHLMLVDLVNYVQAEPGGNIGIDVSQVTASGVQRIQSWKVTDQKNIGDVFRQKGDNLGGFDFDLRVELGDTGLPVRRLRMWTPRRGRPFVQGASPVFNAGRNGNALAIPSAPADGTRMGTVFVGLGAETNPTTQARMIARKVRQDLLDAGYPRLMLPPLDLRDVSDQNTLQAHVDGAAYYRGAVALDELVIEVNPDDKSWPWGSYETGDDCQLVIPTGADPKWPTGFSGPRRIIATQWAKAGREEHLYVHTGRLLGS